MADIGVEPVEAPVTADPSLRHLLARLAQIEARVRAATAARRARDHRPDDSFRGLYLSGRDVDRLLHDPEQPDAPAPEEAAHRLEADRLARSDAGDLRLPALARTFGLDETDLDLLLVAMAPDLDARFERLYGYLNDDVTRRRATAGLALSLVRVPVISAEARARLGPRGPLVDGGLLAVEDRARPFLSRSLEVPDRVVQHLLGDDRHDPRLDPILADPMPLDTADAAALARALAAGAGLHYLRERSGTAAPSIAAGAFARLGVPRLVLDLQLWPEGGGWEEIAEVAVREARLRGAGLVAGPVEALGAGGRAGLRRLAETEWPVVLHGSAAWDPIWSRRPPLVADLEPMTQAERAEVWNLVLPGAESAKAARVTQHLRLNPQQVARAAESARLRAVSAARPLEAGDLLAGALWQNAAGLERLARRVPPAAGWEDLVLPAPVVGQLRDIAVRAQHRDRVVGTWRVGGRANRRHSVTALFAGPPGTGKTMAAEVLARELGVDLYAVNLATVVDKYIGETEKNLERIFTEAERVNSVIFFDEADALFGKRSEVRDARDRYANVEVAYLLQRMELFEGIALLASNLKANLDEAFSRRLDAVVEFPMPRPAQRRRLWELSLGDLAPRGSDVDLDFMAERFELSGGNIRNVALAAVFRAVDLGRPLAMEDLIYGTQREYRKLGRMSSEAEFGPFFELARSL